MSVHYKFKSNLDHDTVTFDGLNISVADLKKSIMHQKKIGKSSDFDLQITNAQTKEVYDNDEMLVPKNTSVIVARIPVQGGTKKNWDKPDLPLPIDEDDLGLIRYDRIAKSADLINANSTEEDKVKAMITQSSQEYDPSKYVKSRSMTGPLPPSYTCFRCGKQGHWIKNCPTNNPDVKRSTGIPRSFMVPVDGPEHKGALLTSSGDYAVPLIDHQAYKEVKKEKPPFVPQDEPVVVPEAEIPSELLCMVCKDLLQDAVLIPCCGNSFCDECVRQVLLESDNHECPICHETEVSPNTLIPNRFLRTAVANYKNEKGYTVMKKVAVAKTSPPVSHPVDSPQPSPDSTVESQSQADNATQPDKSPKTIEVKKDNSTVEAPGLSTPTYKTGEGSNTPSVCHTPENVTPKASAEDDSEDAQPGTPLADEPPIDVINHHLPIQTIGHEHYNSERYEYSSKYSRSHREDYSRRYPATDTQEPRPISTIETITNIRKNKFLLRPAPVRQQFLNQRPHRDDRPENYSHEREDYHGRYDKRHPPERSSRRTAHHSHYDRSDRESRYPSSSAHEYPLPEHDHGESHYEAHQHEENSVRRHPDRYRSSPHPVIIPQPVPGTIYTAPVPTVPPIHPVLLQPTQVFAPQPPPPGASPVNTSQIASQPPPPGVGPLLPVSGDSTSTFNTRPFESEDPLKDPKKIERSFDDRMEEFQRKLEKRDRKYSRDRGSRSRSRSSERHRSRSSSRSRSYSSSKSWTRSHSRGSTRTSRSRSRTPFSSRSRTRSYSHSRSRSWSKKRSYTRSRSRTESRSRSRSRNESRVRRRGTSRDRQWSPRSRARSHSFSPKSYNRHASHRSETFASKRNYNPPQYPAGTSYQSQYGPPPAIIPLTVMRPPAFPPHHLHSMHPPIQPIHSRPIEQYPPVERPMKYPPSYGNQYPVYDVYQQKYQQQRFDREQRFSEHRATRYDKRPDYPRHEEEVLHRIPGWVGDRSREYKPRYRQARDLQRKEIRELPQVSEQDIRSVHSKESSMDAPTKKKEEKVTSKHKKHHHHHKSKDVKKQESKVSRASADRHSDSSKILVKVEPSLEREEKKVLSEVDSKVFKTSEKIKDKKHKHKKHKINEQPAKKKRSVKKEKVDGVPSTDSDLPPLKVKTKKKKVKPKAEAENKLRETSTEEQKVLSPVLSPVPKFSTEDLPIPNDLPEEKVADKLVLEQDVLDIFADDPEQDTVDLNTKAAQDTSIDELQIEGTDNLDVIETENIEESFNSEEEIEEEVLEDENILRVDVPGISKWEREESEDEESTVPQRRSSVVVSVDETGPISSDIISRAENVLLSKQFKPRIESKDEGNSKDSSEASSRESTPVKRKEVVELKSVVNSEQLHSDTLQVIISNNKEKRSVYSRKDDGRSSKGDSMSSKRARPDKTTRSTRHYDDPNPRRSVVAHSVRGEERSREYRDNKVPDRREHRYSSPHKGRMNDRNSSREYSRRSERDIESREETFRREDRKRKFESSRSEYSGSHERRRDQSAPQSRKKPYEREVPRILDKVSKGDSYKKSRSGSLESRDSFDSCMKRGDKHQPTEERHHQRSERERIQGDQHETNRRKHSPIKPPGTSSDHPKPVKKEYHDELKFEPDYDEFSDVEEKRHENKERLKRKAVSPESRKSKVEKPSKIESSVKPHRTDKSSVTSSVSSSAASESDSSDSDEPRGSKSKSSDTDHKQKHKKSRHKKHKKHKHKHKKKKSHKSKKI